MAKVGAGRTEIVGLRDFQRELRALDKKLGTELRQGLKRAAEVGAEGARARAGSGNRMQASAAASIKAQAEQRAAKVSFGSAAIPYAVGAFMGALAYPQFEPWVGNTWAVGQPGEGPYLVNQGLADRMEAMLDEVGKEIERLAGRAFPD